MTKKKAKRNLNGEKRRISRFKLVTIIISMVSAVTLLAVGVFASLFNFDLTIANQLNLNFEIIEGNLYATRMGQVADVTRTTSKVLSESTNPLDWTHVYSSSEKNGVIGSGLETIQEKVNFISDNAILDEKYDNNLSSVAITYYFYYMNSNGSTSTNIKLTKLAGTSQYGINFYYKYIKAGSSTLNAADFTNGSATELANGDIITAAPNENLFIMAECRVSLNTSIKFDDIDWKFNLDFTVSHHSLQDGILTYNPVINASTYELWVKADASNGASLQNGENLQDTEGLQNTALGDADSILGTCIKIVDKGTLAINVKEALKGYPTGDYTLTVIPKDDNGDEISNNRIVVHYAYTVPALEVNVTDTAIGGNYFYYVELGEYPQTIVSDSILLTSLNSLGDSAKTGRTFTVGYNDDSAQTAHAEYMHNGIKYVKVASAVVNGTDAQYKFSNGAKATTGNTYWFKVEPIRWYLLEEFSTTKRAYGGATTNIRVISEKSLTANVMFNKSVSNQTCNIWGTSNIRLWLNLVFYEDAFTAADKGKIQTNLTRYNSTGNYTTKDDYTVTSGGTTNEDKVWLPSYYEMGNTYYGTNLYVNKSGRYAYHTDFAVANKLYIDSNTLRGWYWLRSAGSASSTACTVGSGGSLYGNGTAYNSLLGVRPALLISI